MRALHLIRHGVTEANEKNVYCGHTDLPLSQGGREQLAALRADVDYPALENYRVITSGMKRANETLRILFGDVTHETEKRFMEMNFGRFELHSYEELCQEADYIAWCSGDNEKNCCPGGESGEGMKQRVLAALYELLPLETDTCLVCHGGTIAIIMGALFPEEPRSRYQWQPKNGRGYTVLFDGGEAVTWVEI